MMDPKSVVVVVLVQRNENSIVDVETDVKLRLQFSSLSSDYDVAHVKYLSTNNADLIPRVVVTRGRR